MANDNNALQTNEIVRHTRLSTRNTVFKYATLDSLFSKDAFSFTGIAVPDLNRSNTVKVYLTHSPSPQFFHTNNLVELVEFRVEGKPYDTTEGKKVLTKAPELVAAVLKQDYEPKTATITYLDKEGRNVTEERSIHDCVITGVEINIDKESNFIKVVFLMQGLLNKGS